jgi:hypothetical protein
MSSSNPTEACIEIAGSINDFLHHAKTWNEVLETIQSEIDQASANCYAIGFYDGQNGKPSKPLEVNPGWVARIR